MCQQLGEEAQEMRRHRDKVKKRKGNQLQQFTLRRFPTFKPVDPNGKCKANGINKEKRQSWEISQYDIWALNAAYDGPLPPCQSPKKVGWKARG